MFRTIWDSWFIIKCCFVFIRSKVRSESLVILSLLYYITNSFFFSVTWDNVLLVIKLGFFQFFNALYFNFFNQFLYFFVLICLLFALDCVLFVAFFNYVWVHWQYIFYLISDCHWVTKRGRTWTVTTLNDFQHGLVTVNCLSTFLDSSNRNLDILKFWIDNLSFLWHS